MLSAIENDILEFIKLKQKAASSEIFTGISSSVSLATLKRILTKLLEEQLIVKVGDGKATKYQLSPSYTLLFPINIDDYYKKEIDERIINENFNFQLISETISVSNIFTSKELLELNLLQENYTQNISQLNKLEYQKELERLAIDLSWKSSQIEGNTYSLLETERLLKDKQTASGKTKEEAIMLLNHKEAIDFIVENPDYLILLSISKIEDIHSLLVKELGVERNIRKRRVGISGTNYKPIDNNFQILEALEATCNLINNKQNVFEKALLALLLISYIQPFIDGNKRTARIVSNAILINHSYCPISFRTVDSIEYKKGLLLFYEQNNLSGFKNIFIDQFKFAVNTYF